MKDKIPCSVLILTRNSAGTLERCLNNLSAFGEVLIHDANSTDDTVEIAKRYGARVEKQYDTDEPCVRITNFTDMRLKQRSDAFYDWVLYIDSDELLSDKLVDELALLIPALHPKTIVKLPRFPVIEGSVRAHGLYYLEIMPRIHHRKSGATLKMGKVVHEKYVYDDSFNVVVTKSPLYVPLESVRELRSKDDFYIQLEGERIHEQGYTWMSYIRWYIFREPLVIVAIIFRILKRLPWYLSAESVPIHYDWRYVRYHWQLLCTVTRVMITKKKLD